MDVDKLLSSASFQATRRKIHFIEASRPDEKMGKLRLKYPAINIKPKLNTTNKLPKIEPENVGKLKLSQNGISKIEVEKVGNLKFAQNGVSKIEAEKVGKKLAQNSISKIEAEKTEKPKKTQRSDSEVKKVVRGPGDAQKILFSPDLLTPDWIGTPKIGSGLANLGNTCFLNASLQCLAYVPAFVQYIRDGDHEKQCNLTKRKKFCALCSLKHVYTKITDASEYRSYRPTPITANLHRISATMRAGHQEDAHEFIHSLFDSIQKCCLHGLDKKMDARSQETTFLHQVFGGYVENQIKCHTCGNESNRYEATLDLSLQVSDSEIQSVSQALKHFTTPEILKGDNKYQCEKCNKKVVASRQSTVYKSPMALQIHLKRFAFSGQRGTKFSKVAKLINYPQVLDMSPYLSKGMEARSRYVLTGVLVHAGSSPTYGHYYSYVKNAAGKWYMMNDDKVTPVEPHVALKQQAYMLYYTRMDTPESTRNALPKMASKVKPALSPKSPAEHAPRTKHESNEKKKTPLDEEKPKSRPSFGERVISVVKEPVRPVSTDFKFQPEVFTWDGEKSGFQKAGKRQRPNMCDLEMDRGKTKKTKLHKKFPTHNPFQFRR